jgi:predicted ribosomally synthesized peptide with nif11-like leader
MGQPMSWSELERLVEEAEAETSLQRALKHCRTQQELVLAARRLGYRITRVDLQRARQLDCRAQHLEQRLG